MWTALVAMVLGLQPSPSPSATTQSLVDALVVDPSGHGCLDADALAAQMKIWLEREQLDARIRITARADPQRRDRVHFSIHDGDTLIVDRPFEPVPADCQATHAALGLAIAIALDNTVLTTLGLDPVPVPVPDPPPPSAPQPPPNQDPAPTPSPPIAFATKLQATSAFALHPIAGFGGRVLMEAFPRPELSVRIGAEATTGLPIALGPGRASLTLVTGRLDLCGGGVPRQSIVHLQGCLGASAGPALAFGRAQARDDRSIVPWAAVVGAFALTVPADARVAFALDVDVDAAFVRPRLVVTNADGDVVDARTVPPVGASLSIGPVIQFR